MNQTREKLIQAAIDSIEHIGLHATTKQIAQRAGVNELTLFRHFSTKQRLIEECITTNLRFFMQEGPQLSGCLEEDLGALAGQYMTFVDAHPGFIMAFFAETNPEIVQTLVVPTQQRFARQLLGVMKTHRQQGELLDIDDADLVRDFMGPLLARAFLHRAMKPGKLIPRSYVRRFLVGHQTDITPATLKHNTSNQN